MTLLSLNFFSELGIFATADTLVSENDQGEYTDFRHKVAPIKGPPNVGFRFVEYAQKIYIFEDIFLFLFAGLESEVQDVLQNLKAIFGSFGTEEIPFRVKAYLKEIENSETIAVIFCHPESLKPVDLSSMSYWAVRSLVSSWPKKLYVTAGSGAKIFHTFENENRTLPKNGKISISLPPEANFEAQVHHHLLMAYACELLGEFGIQRFGGWHDIVYFEFPTYKWKRIRYSVSYYQVYENDLALIHHARSFRADDASGFVDFCPGGLLSNNFEISVTMSKSLIEREEISIPFAEEVSKPTSLEVVLVTNPQGTVLNILTTTSSVIEAVEDNGSEVLTMKFNRDALVPIRDSLKKAGIEVSDRFRLFNPKAKYIDPA